MLKILQIIPKIEYKLEVVNLPTSILRRKNQGNFLFQTSEPDNMTNENSVVLDKQTRGT